MTIVELMVTILIVTILATSLGVFFVKLLTLQEQDREEAYIRERISDICGLYADYLSVGSSICTNNEMTLVKYREETGGVSLETGRVSRVTRLRSSNKVTDQTLNMEAGGIVTDDNDQKSFDPRFSRILRGDAELIALVASNKVICSLTPLNYTRTDYVTDVCSSNATLRTTDAALALLKVTTWYETKDKDKKIVTKEVSAERIVRLWNHE